MFTDITAYIYPIAGRKSLKRTINDINVQSTLPDDAQDQSINREKLEQKIYTTCSGEKETSINKSSKYKTKINFLLPREKCIPSGILNLS